MAGRFTLIVLIALCVGVFFVLFSVPRGIRHGLVCDLVSL